MVAGSWGGIALYFVAGRPVVGPYGHRNEQGVLGDELEVCFLVGY